MDKLLKIVYDAMDEKQADNIEIIDFNNHSAFFDYLVIGDASNYRKARAIIENVVEQASKNNYPINYYSVSKDSKWLIVDLKNVICHVFYDGERTVYNIEGLWKDLPRIKM